MISFHHFFISSFIVGSSDVALGKKTSFWCPSLRQIRSRLNKTADDHENVHELESLNEEDCLTIQFFNPEQVCLLLVLL